MIQISEKLIQQMECVNEHYPLLGLIIDNDKFIVAGLLKFCAQHIDHEEISDEFNIEMHISSAFPDDIILVYETERTQGYEHKYTNGALCLGSPLEIGFRVRNDTSLISYIKNLIVPYFYFFVYFQKYGIKPFSDLEHGKAGLVSSYQKRFNTSNISIVNCMMRYRLTHERYNINTRCPCGSNKILRDCFNHRMILTQLYLVQPSFIRAELNSLKTRIK
ncbi:MAG: hypothetical protein PHO32_07885 [Candidatus Cloacimonetes bacterium]|nr:hypothetical protein [Candidatus Cloacimonadota bacterium]